ncbi:MAG: hypothetical protein ABI151_17740, partial [Chitinophagaceae bacterium]
MEQTFFKSPITGFNIKKLAFSAILIACSFASFSAPEPPTDGMAKVTSLGIQNGEMIFRIRTENL